MILRYKYTCVCVCAVADTLSPWDDLKITLRMVFYDIIFVECFFFALQNLLYKNKEETIKNIKDFTFVRTCSCG